MKITGLRITENTTIKVSSWEDNTERLSTVKSWDTEENINFNKKLLKNNILFDVPYGSVKKNSPTLRVSKVSHLENGVVVIYTDKGNGVIGTNQKVELIG